jgi:osmotically-inducible protein OsmY
MAPALGVAGWAEVRLRDNGYRVLKKISCEYREGVLTLRGRLPSYYLKQVAQETVARVAGVQRIDNQIEVLASV